MQGAPGTALTLASPARLLLVAAAAAVVLALDRFTKNAVAAALAPGETREVVGDTLRITHVQNTGAAFGLLPERTLLLSVLSVIAVIVIVAYYRQLRSDSRLIAATLGLVLGGAVGNLYDRVTQGYVVDFVDAGIGPYRWWTFNVADASIVVGIGAVLAALWLEERRGK